METQVLTITRDYKERYDLIRHADRIRSSDVIEGVFDSYDYFESPDPSLKAARARIDGIDCIILGQEKRRQGKESEATGMLNAKGFGYTLDVLDIAEQEGLPIISFIDTFGGDTSMESEIGGQSFLISDCISRYCGVNTATLSYVIGEGGSGGALANQVADKSFMLQNALYSVIAPESCSRIIYHKRLAAGESMEETVKDSLNLLRPGAEHIQEIGMIDGILPEPEEGAHTDYPFTFNVIKESIIETLNQWVESKNGKKVLKEGLVEELVAKRRTKVLNYGQFSGKFDKLTKRTPKRSTEVQKSLDIEREDFYTHILMRAYLDREGIQDTELIECEKGWDQEANKFRVAGGCGYIAKQDYINNYYACPKCGKGEYLSAEEQIEKICDEDTFHEIEADLTITKMIGSEKYYFGKYKDSLVRTSEKTFSNEGLVAGTAKLNGRDVVVAITDLKFFGGSFGAAFGEKFKRAVDFAVEHKYPLISICSSGGARMNEGPMSLAQMAKMNMSLLDLKRKGIMYLSVISGPTTGGAYASYVTQGDVMIGERGALVEFAGPRVVTGAGFEVDPKIVITDHLYQTGKIQHLCDRKDLKDVLGYNVDLYYDLKKPEQRRITGRIRDFRLQ